MTTILAIETSTEVASAALLSDRGLIARELSGVQTHSQGILPMIQEVLSEAGISLHECDAIGFGCGPGAFTGVRTACGIVQGLAFGADLPVVPIVSLLAMAEAARAGSGVEHAICVLDARMEEIYWAQYRYLDGAWQVVRDPVLSNVEQMLQQADLSLASLVLGKGVEMPDLAPAARQIASMPHASHIAQLSKALYQAGKVLPAAQAQPMYLRNKVALTTDERLQVARAKQAGKEGL